MDLKGGIRGGATKGDPFQVHTMERVDLEDVNKQSIQEERLQRKLHGDAVQAAHSKKKSDSMPSWHLICSP